MVASLRLYELIADNTTDLVCLHDSLNTIRYATPSAKVILGYNPSELEGKKLTDFLSEDFLNEMDFETLKRFFDNPGARIRYQVRHADRRLRWLETKFNNVNQPLSKEFHILSSTRDITESVHLTEDLMEALSNEQEVSSFKSNLYSVASHEFKTPLAVIQANIEMLKVKSSEKFLKIALLSMEEEIDKLNGMIADMLQLKKLAANETPFYPAELNLTQLLEEIIENDIKGVYPKIDVIMKLDKALKPVLLTGDYSLLRYVFGNIISNACKYSDKNTTVTINIKYKTNNWQVEVIDTGIGIPKEDQDTIFTSFFRASNVGNIAGTGVGLSIVKEFINKHHGDISFVSDLKKGTTFKVVLPINNSNHEKENFIS